MEFDQYLASDSDRQRFADFIRDSTVLHEGLPCALHVHLRDSMGSQFAVELLHACFPDIDDQPCHVIGIREVGDFSAGPATGSGLSTGRQVPAEALSHSALPCSDPASLKAGSKADAVSPISSRSSTSSWSSCSEHLIELPELQEISVRFDALSEGFRILHCSL